MKELADIQCELHAPKDKSTNKGQAKKPYDFEYRDAEGIIKAAKPLLKKHKCQLVCDMDLQEIAGRVYVVISATITNEDGEYVTAKGYAREPENLGNQQVPQVTGSCITYAKKYALCNLFAIDDSTADPDAITGKTDSTVNEIPAWIKVEAVEEMHYDGKILTIPEAQQYKTEIIDILANVKSVTDGKKYQKKYKGIIADEYVKYAFELAKYRIENPAA